MRIDPGNGGWHALKDSFWLIVGIVVMFILFLLDEIFGSNK